MGLLRAAGYQVLQAGTPREARQLAAEAQSDVDLLLTDVVLPDETGPALAAALNGQRPDLRVLFMSGYPRDRGGQDFAPDSHRKFLPKPFTRESLLAAVRDALARAAS